MTKRIKQLAARTRRGTVIVLAIAVLAIISIAAVAYVVVVRIDRDAAAAAANDVNYDQQVSAVVSEMQAILSADLFGNKITTIGTPQSLGGVRVWPRMFENGQFATVAAYRPPATPPANPPTLNPLDRTNINNRVGPRESPWLASNEPEWGTAAATATTWRQITNLRLAYRWNPQASRWVKGDGAFVDLAQWFLNPLTGGGPSRGNPGVDLIAASGLGPVAGASIDSGDNATGRTDVFDRQIAGLVTGTPGLFSNVDERQWADTDGDGRPDARWQQLDVLGNLFGLNWVVAARIIDASALINVNSSIEFNYPTVGTADVNASDGQTPADIDLYRFIGSAATAGFPQPLRTDLFPAAYANEHVPLGLNLPGIFAQLANTQLFNPAEYPSLTGGLSPTYTPWSDANPLSRQQRRAFWELVGSSPAAPAAGAASMYPQRDMVDLYAFWSTNNGNLVSKIEQRMDGPDPGYLPSQGSGSPNTGPLRANESPTLARSYASGTPTRRSIYNDIRRQLTTVSGVGSFSPIPVLNNSLLPSGGCEFDSVFTVSKVRLPDLARRGDAIAGDRTNIDKPAGISNDLTQSVFNAFAWALLPFSTDQQPMPGAPSGLNGNTNGLTSYGGFWSAANASPAEIVQAETGQPIGSAYAVLRAGSLTANLIAATSRVPGSAGDREPYTAVTFLPRSDQPIQSIISRLGGAGTPSGTRFVNARLPQGNIPQALMPAAYLGQPDGGVTFLPLDRQVFLREVHSYAAYTSLLGSDGLPSAQGAGGQVTIDPSDPNQQLGSIIAVEIGNPWPDPVRLDGYSLRLSDGTTGLKIDLDKPSVTVDPGQVAILYVETGSPAAFDTASGGALAWDTLRDAWLASVRQATTLQNTRIVALDPAAFSVDRGPGLPGGTKVFFQTLADPTDSTVSPREWAATLIVEDGSRAPAGPVLVDRLNPPPATSFSFPRALRQPVAIQIQGNANGRDQGAARIAVSSSLSRPTGDALTRGGFPHYVVERPGANSIGDDGPAAALPTQQSWFLPLETTPVAETVPSIVGILRNDGNSNRLGRDKGPLRVGGGAIEPVPFSLFVPNAPVQNVSELALLCPFAHTWINPSGVLGSPTIDLSDFDARATVPQPRRWTTISEYLGHDAHYFYGDPANGVPNPAFGALDYVHYIPANVPLPMALPMASRVFDCFEALEPVSDLAQGRININTASREVIRMLPFIDPAADITAQSGRLPALSDDGRINRIDNARRATEALPGDTGLPGLALNFNSTSGAGVERGIPSLGLLPLLDTWDPITGRPRPPGGNASGFAYLGADPAGAAVAGVPLSLNNRYARPEFRAPATPEERLAVFRAISNIVSTRSDVFIAWFVLRGYDPEVIEGISGAAASAMNSPDFRPAYESRWLVVFDRSNIRRPTDRPRVLLQVEIPPSRF
ncbi:MAG: hypothetical protein IBJ11_05925 [Phycisphaerales bacterium]|nr:hypothetical protein [Phycisphaerales bacterium]